MAQMAIIAAVVLQDSRDEPLLPRWTAYVCIWSALGVASGSLCVFTDTGPFAWNGVLAWYLLCVAFFAWMVTMTWGMLRASKRAEDPAPTPAPEVQNGYITRTKPRLSLGARLASNRVSRRGPCRRRRGSAGSSHRIPLR